MSAVYPPVWTPPWDQGGHLLAAREKAEVIRLGESVSTCPFCIIGVGAAMCVTALELRP